MIRPKLLIAGAIVASVVTNACSDVTAPKKVAPAVRSLSESSPRSGALKATKECSGFTGGPGSFCTITSSTLEQIEVGTRIVYLQPAAVPTVAGSDVILYPPERGSSTAFGHCSTKLGVCTFSGGTGQFTHFEASVVVTHLNGRNWAWDGTYSFGPRD